MPGQKRQHYFPQVIQRNFIAKGDSTLWVYDRQKNDFRNQATTQIAVEGHLYTLKNPELVSQKYAIEDALGKLEGDVAPVFAKLREQVEISQEEKNLIAEYVAFQTFRTPEQLKVIKNISLLLGKFMYQELALDLARMPNRDFEQTIRQYEKEVGHKLNLTQEGIRETVESGRVGAKLDPDHHLGTMIDVATDLAIEFSKRKWAVLHTPKKVSLIGSDCPVIVRHKDMAASTVRIGAAASDATTMFVFSRDTALLIKSERIRTIEHVAFSKRGARILNDQLAIESQRIIFSHSKNLLQATASRNQLSRWRHRFAYKDDMVKEMAKKIVSEDMANSAM